VAKLRVGYQIFGFGRYFPSAWWKGAFETYGVRCGVHPHVSSVVESRRRTWLTWG
jgi:hypothetical protein